MHSLLHALPVGPKPPSIVTAVVEIPKGSVNKYEYDYKTGYFRLDRVLRQTIFYPTEYGFIPQTWNAKDDDPLDIMVVSNFPTFTGCVLTVRPIGVILLNDTGEQDNKIVSVLEGDPRFQDIGNLSDLSSHFKPEIENFWKHYSSLEPNKTVEVQGWKDAKAAQEMIKQGIVSFKEKFTDTACK